MTVNTKELDNIKVGVYSDSKSNISQMKEIVKMKAEINE